MVDPIQIASLLFLAATTVYIAVLIYNSLRASALMARTASREREVLKAKTAEILVRSRSEEERLELSWNGFRKFEIADRRSEANGSICSFYLKPRDKRPLPPFRPGQYLTFRLHLPDDKKPLIRCYSLSDSCKSDYYRVTIKKLPPPHDKPELPPGRASSYFHDRLAVGDILDVKAPTGHFFLDSSRETPIVLIAGGVGITPLLSMLNAVVESGLRREVWFFLGVRNSREHPMKVHLETLARENENVHLCVCYSEPTADCVPGRDYHRAGHVDVELIKPLLSSNNYAFYLCGPPPMMTALHEQLQDWGVPERRINYEAFGPATVKRLKESHEPAPAAQQAVTVTFAKSHKTVKWDPAADSLLDFAEDQGISIDHGCRAGNCGTCLTAIRSGEVDYVGTPGEMPEQGSCLVCLTVPKSDLELDA